MDRRGFMILSGETVTGLALKWGVDDTTQSVSVTHSRITHELTDHLHARVTELWQLDDVLGGGSCLDAAVADLRLVERLIRHGDYSADLGV